MNIELGGQRRRERGKKGESLLPIRYDIADDAQIFRLQYMYVYIHLFIFN